jgi:hypothetical protein
MGPHAGIETRLSGGRLIDTRKECQKTTHGRVRFHGLLVFQEKATAGLLSS